MRLEKIGSGTPPGRVRDILAGITPSRAWDSGEGVESKIHRIHPYPAKFPAFIAKKAIEYAHGEGIHVRKVADVFCGCGTVAYEAQRAGLSFWGCDINPVATLIARAKSEAFVPARIEAYAQAVLIAFEKTKSNLDLAPEAGARLRYWHPPVQFEQLSRLLTAIRTRVPQRSNYRLALECAFSAILKPTSMWQQRSAKPAYDPSKRPADVASTFAKQCAFLASAWREASEELQRGATTVVNQSVLETRSSRPVVDMIITSPPYVTSYEYADIHQLSSLWLGYASDYRVLRRGSIGSSQTDIQFSREYKRLNETGSRTVFSLYGVSPEIARTTLSYCLDMQGVAQRCHDMIRPGGVGVFVIGNTEYRGISIDNASHLAESLFNVGFNAVNVVKRRITNKAHTPFRSSDGKLSSSPAAKCIYGEEYILMAHK